MLGYPIARPSTHSAQMMPNDIVDEAYILSF